jgi:hypothetical protein
VLTLDSLITLVQGVARQPNLWRPGVHFGTRSRHTTRLHRDDQVEMWVTSWLPGSPPEQRDGAPHNHGDSIGVFTVVEGELIEERIDRDGQLLVSRLTPSVIRPLAPHLAHDVRNTSELPAISIHAATVAASARAACVVPVLSWPRRAELSRPHARTA